MGVLLLVLAAVVAACTTNIGDGVITTPTFAPITAAPEEGSIPAPTEIQPSSALVVHATGEALLDPTFIPAADEASWRQILRPFAALFRSDDLTIVSLSCPAGEVGEPALLFNSRRCDADAIEALAGAGVDVVSLAHPHLLDQGPEAVTETIRLIEGAGMVPVGAGADLDEARETKFLVREGFTIALVSASLAPSPIVAASDAAPTIHHILDPVDFAARLEDAIDGSDYLIVSLHGGTENLQDPDQELILTAEAASTAGADFVFTSGAHRLYRLAVIDDAPIAFGLGDFVYPFSSDAAADAAVAALTLAPASAPMACLLPATVQTDGSPQLDDPDIFSCS